MLSLPCSLVLLLLSISLLVCVPPPSCRLWACINNSDTPNGGDKGKWRWEPESLKTCTSSYSGQSLKCGQGGCQWLGGKKRGRCWRRWRDLEMVGNEREMGEVKMLGGLARRNKWGRVQVVVKKLKELLWEMVGWTVLIARAVGKRLMEVGKFIRSPVSTNTCRKEVKNQKHIAEISHTLTTLLIRSSRAEFFNQQGLIFIFIIFWWH